MGKRAYASNHTVKIRWLLKTKDVDGPGASPAMTESECGAFQNKSGRVFRPGRLKLRSADAAKAQLAFFTNTGLPTFFSIARLRSSARGESTSALALIK